MYEKMDASTLKVLLSSTLPVGVNPASFKIAYGRRAIPKLVQEISDPNGNLALTQKALVTLVELIHNPEHASDLITSGGIPKVIALLNVLDSCIRQKSTEATMILSTYATGNAALIKAGSLSAFKKLFDVDDLIIRRNVHSTLLNIANQLDGCHAMLKAGLVKPLINKVQKEAIAVQELILLTLYNLIRVSTEDATEAQAIPKFHALLKPETCSAVKVALCKCIMMICFDAEAKKLACREGVPQTLLLIINDRNTAVRAAIAGALMSITVEIEGKRIVVRDNGIPLLANLLKDQDETVLLNVVRTITNVAEDWRGRSGFSDCLERLRDLSVSQNTLLADAAKRAIEVITWRP